MPLKFQLPHDSLPYSQFALVWNLWFYYTLLTVLTMKPSEGIICLLSSLPMCLWLHAFGCPSQSCLPWMHTELHGGDRRQGPDTLHTAVKEQCMKLDGVLRGCEQLSENTADPCSSHFADEKLKLRDKLEYGFQQFFVIQSLSRNNTQMSTIWGEKNEMNIHIITIFLTSKIVKFFFEMF